MNCKYCQKESTEEVCFECSNMISPEYPRQRIEKTMDITNEDFKRFMEEMR